MFGRKELLRKVDELERVIEQLKSELFTKEEIEYLVLKTVIDLEGGSGNESWESVAESEGLLINGGKGQQRFMAHGTAKHIFGQIGEKGFRDVIYVMVNTVLKDGEPWFAPSDTMFMLSTFIGRYRGNRGYDRERLVEIILEIGKDELKRNLYPNGDTTERKYLNTAEMLKREYNKRSFSINEKIL